MEKVVSAHQPNFLPYLGFFDKMRQSGIFVIRDEVQFVRSDWHKRNSIRIDGTDEDGNLRGDWVTVPVKDNKAKKEIREMIINNEVQIGKGNFWNQRMLNRIRSNYETTPFFKQYFPALQGILSTRYERLVDLNMAIILWLRECFNISTEIVRATELRGYEKAYEPNEDLIRITKACNGDVYLSGDGGKEYLRLEQFSQAGIEVRFQEFHHPVYPQRFHGFVPKMASIDALFNVGPEVFNGEYAKKN